MMSDKTFQLGTRPTYTQGKRLQLEEITLEIRRMRRESRTLSIAADELEKELKEKVEEYRDLFDHDPFKRDPLESP